MELELEASNGAGGGTKPRTQTSQKYATWLKSKLGASQQITSSPSSFPQFSRLPIELRRLIWSRALPDLTSPAVFHTTVRWLARQMTFDPYRFCRREGDIGFRVKIYVTIYDVCRESRQVVDHWALENHVERRTLRKKTVSDYKVWLRPLNFDTDMVYFAEEWAAGLTGWPRGISYRLMRYLRQLTQHLVLPAAFVDENMDEVAAILGSMRNLKATYVSLGSSLPGAASIALEQVDNAFVLPWVEQDTMREMALQEVDAQPRWTLTVMEEGDREDQTEQTTGSKPKSIFARLDQAKMPVASLSMDPRSDVAFKRYSTYMRKLREKKTTMPGLLDQNGNWRYEFVPVVITEEPEVWR